MQLRGIFPNQSRLPRAAGFYFGTLLIVAAAAPLALRPLPVNPLPDSGKAIRSQMFLPASVESTLRRACYDCHSDETAWPWYSRVPLAGDAVRDDVRRARAAMNFSEWNDTAGKTVRRAAGTLIAGCADLRTGRMPVTQYVRMHPEARMTPSEINQFCQWTESLTRAARQPK